VTGGGNEGTMEEEKKKKTTTAFVSTPVLVSYIEIDSLKNGRGWGESGLDTLQSPETRPPLSPTLRPQLGEIAYGGGQIWVCFFQFGMMERNNKKSGGESPFGS